MNYLCRLQAVKGTAKQQQSQNAICNNKSTGHSKIKIQATQTNTTIASNNKEGYEEAVKSVAAATHQPAEQQLCAQIRNFRVEMGTIYSLSSSKNATKTTKSRSNKLRSVQ